MLAKAENVWRLPPRTRSAFNPVFDIAYGSMEAKKCKADRGRGSREKVVVCLGCVWKDCFSSIPLIHVGPAWETMCSPEISSCYRRDPNCQFCVATASLECAGSNQQIVGRDHALLCRAEASRSVPRGDEWVMGTELQIHRESKHLMSNNVISHLSLISLLRIILCPMTSLARYDMQGKSSLHALWQTVHYV